MFRLIMFSVFQFFNVPDCQNNLFFVTLFNDKYKNDNSYYGMFSTKEFLNNNSKYKLKLIVKSVVL